MNCHIRVALKRKKCVGAIRPYIPTHTRTLSLSLSLTVNASQKVWKGFWQIWTFLFCVPETEDRNHQFST